MRVLRTKPANAGTGTFTADLAEPKQAIAGFRIKSRKIADSLGGKSNPETVLVCVTLSGGGEDVCP